MVVAVMLDPHSLANEPDGEEYWRLRKRFIETVIGPLMDTDGFVIDVPGDRVMAVYPSGFCGLGHARLAVDGARQLVALAIQQAVTSETRRKGQALDVAPVFGVGAHTGRVYIGTSPDSVPSIVVEMTERIEAVGFNANVAAALAFESAFGEALISDATASAAGLNVQELKHRDIPLEGTSQSIRARVIGRDLSREAEGTGAAEARPRSARRRLPEPPNRAPSPAPPLTGAIPMAGELLARDYRLEWELGHGTMGKVFVAHDIKRDRPVAVKVMAPHAMSRVDADRFRQEIRDAARLTHPNILAVHDSGEVCGVPYFVMPLIEGESLRARLEREKTLPRQEAIRIARLLASGLSHAHAQGIIHRDVKPANVLLDWTGNPYLCDFGLARSIRRDAQLTESGVIVGSPAYMSPEQIQGERELDGRADLYSLGCVLFEMLSGKPPFTAGSVTGVLVSHLHDDPPSLRHMMGIPRELDLALGRALAKPREDRHSTVGKFELELRQLEIDWSSRRKGWRRWL